VQGHATLGTTTIPAAALASLPKGAAGVDVFGYDEATATAGGYAITATNFHQNVGHSHAQLTLK
jgi:hypothetical protein